MEPYFWNCVLLSIKRLIKIVKKVIKEKKTLFERELYSTANDPPQTANEPRNGLQMIIDLKYFPAWTEK